MTKSEPKKSILIVDDDDDLREAINDLMEHEGWDAIECNGADKAIEILKERKFTLILSDFRMPGKSGKDLLKWCIDESIESIFIFMSGYADIKNPQDAIAEGAQGFISKPFSINALKEYLNDFDFTSGDNNNRDEIEFLPVPQKTIIPDCELPFSIYLKLDGRFVRILHKGESLSRERQANYKEKGVKTFYLTESGYITFLQFSTSMVQSLSANKNVEVEQKLEYAVQVASSVFTQMQEEGVKKESLQIASDITNTTLESILNDKKSFELLSTIIDENQYLFTHSMSVSMVSLMIAKELGWEDSESQFLISTTGLLHDIAKKDWPEDLILGKITHLTALQKHKIDHHPIEGAMLAKSCPELPIEVSEAIGQHHENCAGTGHPRGLKEHQIHPLAKIVYLSDFFINKLTAAKKQNMTKFWVFCALASEANKFDNNMLVALMKVFRYSAKEFGLIDRKVS